MFIDADRVLLQMGNAGGKVGIGKAPVATLDVNGTIAATSFSGNLNASQLSTGTVPYAVLPVGTGASMIAAGTHASQHASGGADPLTPSAIGLGNVENTALSTWAGSTSLTTLGNLGVKLAYAQRTLYSWSAGQTGTKWVKVFSGGNTDPIVRFSLTTTSNAEFSHLVEVHLPNGIQADNGAAPTVTVQSHGIGWQAANYVLDEVRVTRPSNGVQNVWVKITARGDMSSGRTVYITPLAGTGMLVDPFVVQDADPGTALASGIPSFNYTRFTGNTWNDGYFIVGNDIYNTNSRVFLGDGNPGTWFIGKSGNDVVWQYNNGSSWATKLTIPAAGTFSADASSIGGRTVNTTAPSTGQVLKWNGSAWAPDTDLASGAPATSPSAKAMASGSFQMDSFLNCDTITWSQGGAWSLVSGGMMPPVYGVYLSTAVVKFTVNGACTVWVSILDSAGNEYVRHHQYFAAAGTYQMTVSGVATLSTTAYNRLYVYRTPTNVSGSVDNTQTWMTMTQIG